MAHKVFYLILAIVLLGGLSMLIAFPPHPAPVKCNGVDVRIHSSHEGYSFVKEQDVLAELYEIQGSLVGLPIDSINTFEIENAFCKNGLFSDVNLYFTPKGKLRVSIRQRDPFFAVYAANGETYYVSVDKGIIPLKGTQKYFLRLMPISGYVTQHYATSDLYNLLKAISKDSFWNDFFVQFYVDPAQGIIAVSRIDALPIIFGKTPKWNEKLNNLKTFINKAVPKFGWNGFKSVNLEYDGQVVVIPSGALRERFPVAEKAHDIAE
jgi:cell division protein FtsQ